MYVACKADATCSYIQIFIRVACKCNMIHIGIYATKTVNKETCQKIISWKQDNIPPPKKKRNKKTNGHKK